MAKFNKLAIIALLTIIIFSVLWFVFKMALKLFMIILTLAFAILVATFLYKKFNKILFLITLQVILFVELPSYAQNSDIPSMTNREEGLNPRDLAMGDAVRAASFGTSGLYFNPAGMSQIYQYVIEAGYSYSDWMSGSTLHISVMDSKTNNNIAAGFGYSYTWSEFPEIEQNKSVTRQGHIIRAAISGGAQFDNVRFLLGGGLKYLDLNRSDEYSINTTNFDAGAILCIYEKFFLGVVGHNLLNVKNPETPIMLGLGSAFRNTTFLLSFDTVFDFKTTEKTKASYMFGTEYTAFQIITIRAGFKIDKILKKNIASGGIGYISELFGLDISYMQDVSDKTYNMINGAVRFSLP